MAVQEKGGTFVSKEKKVLRSIRDNWKQNRH